MLQMGALRNRRRLAAAALLAGGVMMVAMTLARPASAAPLRSRINALIRGGIAHHGIRAAILQITAGGRPIITKAYGSSMAGVPATTRMHFRNSAVAVSYMATLLLTLVDDGRVSLDDKVARWLPHIPHARQVTLGMLAGMDAGYHDYELDPKLDKTLYADPFTPITTADQLRWAFDEPLQFTPGTNWSYSHSDYVILGLALQKITGMPLARALQRRVLEPLGLRNTVASQTAAIPSPVLHAYSPERKQFLGIRRSKPFDEDSTFWNPSWTLARGAVETTDIRDLTRTAIGIGSGRLLTRASYRLMTNPRLGFGHPQKGCERCTTLTRRYGYGLGIVRNGDWLLQNPLFGGYAAIESYLPSKRISIALALTFKRNAYDYAGNPGRFWIKLYGAVGRIVAPNDPPIG